MKKRSISLIIGLMGLALLGVMAMQLYFLRQSYQMQSELFDRSVNEALNNVVSKVTKQDANNFLNSKAQVRAAEIDDAGIKVVKSAENKSFAPKPGKWQTLRQKKIALLRDSLERMIKHQKLDDELSDLLQQEGTVDIKVTMAQFTDDAGIVHASYKQQ